MKLGITMLIHNKDDIEFVTELPWFLGHPVLQTMNSVRSNNLYKLHKMNVLHFSYFRFENESRTRDA